MLNSFNLFLSLLAFWAIFMIASNHISWLYIICGVLAAIFVTIISTRLKLVKKNSEMLYLSLGFYRHFIKLFFGNFVPSLKLLFRLAAKGDLIIPTTHKITNDVEGINFSALISTINMSCGLLVIDLKDEKTILIHAAEKPYFENFNLKKMQKALLHINDDNLV